MISTVPGLLCRRFGAREATLKILRDKSEGATVLTATNGVSFDQLSCASACLDADSDNDVGIAVAGVVVFASRDGDESKSAGWSELVILAGRHARM